VAQELPIPLPPITAPDGVFSDARRSEPSVAMIPPSADGPAFVPYPPQPGAISPQYVPSPPEALFPAEDAPAVYYDLFGRPNAQPPIVRQLTYRKTFLPP